MKRVDLKKELKNLYQPPAKEVVEVEVPPMSYLMIDGAGDPNQSPAYPEAVEALFGLSYTLKFMVKKGPLAIDYGVLPLEGLWWAADMAAFTEADRAKWRWTMMIAQPEWVTSEMVGQARDEVKRKKDLPALLKARFERFSEGLCSQVLHIGPFSEEGPTIERLHQFIELSGGRRTGKHHEIYLSDIRKADPARWRTVIRQPMARGAAPSP
jgi:hypothetical protein